MCLMMMRVFHLREWGDYYQWGELNGDEDDDDDDVDVID